jgi:hypothetical protein
MSGINWQPIVGYVLLTIAAIYYAGPFVVQGTKRMIGRGRKQTIVDTVNSVAPAGFADHVTAIKSVADSATPAERERYYEEALTRTQTLEREVKRLSAGRI